MKIWLKVCRQWSLFIGDFEADWFVNLTWIYDWFTVTDDMMTVTTNRIYQWCENIAKSNRNEKMVKGKKRRHSNYKQNGAFEEGIDSEDAVCGFCTLWWLFAWISVEYDQELDVCSVVVPPCTSSVLLLLPFQFKNVDDPRLASGYYMDVAVRYLSDDVVELRTLYYYHEIWFLISC